MPGRPGPPADPRRYHRGVAAATARRIDPWLLVALACAIGFVMLGIVVNGRGWFALDEPVAALVQALPVPTDAWLAITQAAAGSAPGRVGLVLVLWRCGSTGRPVVVAIALLAATFATDLLKDLVAPPAPAGPGRDRDQLQLPVRALADERDHYGSSRSWSGAARCRTGSAVSS